MGTAKPACSFTTILTNTHDTPSPNKPRPNKKPLNVALLALSSAIDNLKKAKAIKTKKGKSNGEKDSVNKIPAMIANTSPHTDFNNFSIMNIA